MTRQQPRELGTETLELFSVKPIPCLLRVSNNRLYFKKMRNQLREITMVINDVLAKLSKVKKKRDGYTALCPSHDDKSPSFSIKEVGDKILVKCFAGCSPCRFDSDLRHFFSLYKINRLSLFVFSFSNIQIYLRTH